jgi:hypothetical protein
VADEAADWVGPGRSGLVTAVAVLHFIGAAFHALLSLFIVAGAAFGTPSLGFLGSELSQWVYAMGGLLACWGLVPMLWGGVLFVGGMGVLHRRRWGRVLGMVLGVISGGLALMSVMLSIPLGVFLYVSYSAFVLVVLLIPHYAKEFRE